MRPAGGTLGLRRRGGMARMRWLAGMWLVAGALGVSAGAGTKTVLRNFGRRRKGPTRSRA